MEANDRYSVNGMLKPGLACEKILWNNIDSTPDLREEDGNAQHRDRGDDLQ